MAESSGAAMKFLLLWIIVFLPSLVVSQNYSLPQKSVDTYHLPGVKKPEQEAPVKKDEESLPEITLYRTPICGACDRAESYLQGKNWLYQNVDVRESRATFAAFVKNAAGQLPQIVIDGVVISGFQPREIERVYDEAKKARLSSKTP